MIIEKLIEWLFIEMHYWKMHVCRVPACLPCAKYRAHSKHIFCRVPWEKLTAKKKATRQTVPLPCASGSSARQRTRHTANVKKSCARHPSTRQRNTHGKKFLLQQEANRQRLEQALSYIQTLGASIGHSPPQFSPLPLPPRARAATPTPVSDLTIL